MNTYMNDKIVETVKAKMKDDGITQEALANRLGMARTNLVRLVNGHVGSVPKRWQDVLDALGLELIAVPKEPFVKDTEKTAPETVPGRNIKTAAKETKLPPEVEELRRRWKSGEFKTKDVPTPGGVYLAPQAHRELEVLFGQLKQPHNYKRTLARLLEITELLPERDA